MSIEVGQFGTEQREASHRLLALLAEPGVSVRGDGETIRVFRPRKGVTVQAGCAPRAAAEALVSDGLASWRQTARGETLALTEAGVARARRQAAPAGWGFRAQHGALMLEDDTKAAPRMVETAESPLLWLYRRGGGRGQPRWLGEAEFAAGERLRADLTLAQMLPRMTVRWEAGPSANAPGQGLSPGEAALAARQRVQTALDVVGPDLSGLLIDVCGFLKGLDAVERERRWPARSAKVVLAIALARLATHYGYRNEAVGKARRGARHMWGAGDYRPAFAVPDPCAST